MRDDLRERREETWNMLIVKGYDYMRVVRTLAEKYDTSESAIKSDIHRMDSWLPKLDHVSHKSGLSRIRELRQNRQRLQQMALEARKEGDPERELAIRRRIDQAVKLDVELAQSLGLTVEEPDKLQHSSPDGEDGAAFAVNIVHEQVDDDSESDDVETPTTVTRDDVDSAADESPTDIDDLPQ